MQGRYYSNLRVLLAALALGFSASACGGGGGGGGGAGGSSPLPPQTQSAPPTQTLTRFGLALLGYDGSAGNGYLQVVSLYDASGKIQPTPVSKAVPFPFMFDFEDTSLAPNGSYGLVADGAKTLRVLNGLSAGNPSASSYTLDLSAYGAYNDLDAVRVLPNGDEAVIAANPDSSAPPTYATSLLEVSGLLSGKPQAAQTIAAPDVRNGLALSADSKVLLARGYNGVTVYSVADTAPAKGALGGWTYHSFTQTANLTSLPPLNAADAHAGMALSPVDSTRAAIVGAAAQVAQIAFLTGLPSSPKAQTLTIGGATNAYAVAVSADGTTAFVGTDKGIAVFSGVNTGSPAQTQSATIATGTGDTVQQITSLGITADGAYVVAVGHAALSGTGYLAVVPISGGTLGAPVGLLSGVAVPDNDQILVQ